ncbi:hypothetical protein GCK72_009395 [Caenorhabditis remanei]|uniref:Uncharacterized protein n=1 Tax=Caenorhabditis remanei TaxID=31234 RepID=A0A6A5H2A1_CAERE|nr:hypothetical protein GCK72_009395 [Caenorhabditis remanei]KAF1761141.1 hypothetical protein GCK72_009395 [Caenorhabditis remanei]
MPQLAPILLEPSSKPAESSAGFFESAIFFVHRRLVSSRPLLFDFFRSTTSYANQITEDVDGGGKDEMRHKEMQIAKRILIGLGRCMRPQKEGNR